MAELPEPRGEAGQTTILIIGLAVVLLMAIGVVVDASAAYLQRQSLDTVADGAALAGADAGSRNEAALYAGGLSGEERLVQSRALARAAVADFLRRARADYPGLTATVGFTAGHEVVVHVRAPLDLPLTVPGSPQRALIGATGSATVLLEE
jgi:Flp pilus assembly protein TadG